MTRTGYVAGSTGSSPGASSDAPGDALHGRLKRQYLDYLDGKSEEIKEQKQARSYQHGAHWTEEQIRVFKKRRQPIVTFNPGARKINAIVGLLERQKQDPRGFPAPLSMRKGRSWRLPCFAMCATSSSGLRFRRGAALLAQSTASAG